MRAPNVFRHGPRGRLARIVLAAVVLLGLGLGAESAAAFFGGSGGSASGNGAIGTASNVTIATNATVATKLQPGGAGDLAFTVNNPNEVSVTITALSISGTVTGCTTPAVTLTSPQTSYLPVTIPANQTSYLVTLTNAVTMGTGATNDCQGQTLSVPLTPTVQL